MNFKEWQKNQKVILIDGSMSLGLEEQGLDLNDKLWCLWQDKHSYGPQKPW